MDVKTSRVANRKAFMTSGKPVQTCVMRSYNARPYVAIDDVRKTEIERESDCTVHTYAYNPQLLDLYFWGKYSRWSRK
jgi:hypothetical protein